MLLDLVNRISSERKVKKKLDIQVWVLSRSSRGRPENVLGTSRINLPGTSLERQIKTSPGRHFRTSPGRQIGTSPGRQIGTSPGRSNRIFRGVLGTLEGDVLGTNICRLRSFWFLIYSALLYFVWNRNSYNSENMGNNWILIVREMYGKTQTFQRYGFLTYFTFGINT